ncbi:SGNH/GDSL hydrolase family protein [Roseivirga misakiensis]|uniref:SGNH hydrolase-type esterase domain-containing protein n=1 Tax=Roseivirga misakiensis TaxID=1563681 RepID=A0A1E5SZQ6_9BACT|nr:GDSL-type esterase/lipase family protein [Roseivirga misakiensis]OEK04586.1 hypothetical protein BFP71_14085 [Roseivirga misakiensis]
MQKPSSKSFAKFALIPIVIFSICILACDNEGGTEPKAPSSSINKILPLGASRVEGDRPAYESYRYELWRMLTEANFTFDFIGTETDNASYPSFNGLAFDRDHEGRGGITSGGIRSGLSNWLNELGSSPDIVLFSSPGGNDGINDYEGSFANINAIIDMLQANNPNVTILIELTAPPLVAEQSTEFLTFYNRALTDIAALAQSESTATSKVIAVDMRTGFTDNFLADDVHYNTAGGRFIAERYFQQLESLLER